MKKTRRFKTFNEFLQEEREALEIKNKTKSEDEIKAFSTEDGLEELQRLSILIDSPNTAQRTSAIGFASHVLHEYPVRQQNMVFSKILKVISKGGPELQVETATKIVAMLNSIDVAAVVPEKLLKFAFRMINSDDTNVAMAWVDPFLAIVKIIRGLAWFDNDIIYRDIVETSLKNADVSKPKHLRLLACKLFGVAAKHVSQQILEESIVPTAVLLCQDTESELRAAICHEIPRLSRCISIDVAADTLIIELEELLRDEETNVILEAISSFVDLTDVLPRSAIINFCLPSFIRHCNSTNVEIQIATTKLLGKLIFSLANERRHSVFKGLTSLYDHFKKLATHSNPDIRRLCIYNFPAVQKSLGRTLQAAHVAPTFCTLAKDMNAEVRAIAACAYHEVIGMLAPDRVSPALRQCFFELLGDVDVSVQCELIEHIDITVAHILSTDTNAASEFQEKIIGLLIEHEKALGLRWRRRQVLFEKIKLLLDTFSVECVYESFGPILLDAMHSQPLPVQLTAATCVSLMLRRHPRWTSRIEITQTLLTKFGLSRNYKDRLVFLDICKCLMEDFSRKWFKDRVLETCLGLSVDDVPNVRRKLCEMLPDLKRLLSLPADCYYHNAVLNAHQKLIDDEDRDVKMVATEVDAVLKSIHLSDSLVDGAMSAEDLRDKEKEVEEDAVLTDDSKFSPDFFRARSIPDIYNSVLSSETPKKAKAKKKTKEKSKKAVASAPLPKTSYKASTSKTNEDSSNVKKFSRIPVLSRSNRGPPPRFGANKGKSVALTKATSNSRKPIVALPSAKATTSTLAPAKPRADRMKRGSF